MSTMRRSRRASGPPGELGTGLGGGQGPGASEDGVVGGTNAPAKLPGGRQGWAQGELECCRSAGGRSWAGSMGAALPLPGKSSAEIPRADAKEIGIPSEDGPQGGPLSPSGGDRRVVGDGSTPLSSVSGRVGPANTGEASLTTISSGIAVPAVAILADADS